MGVVLVVFSVVYRLHELTWVELRNLLERGVRRAVLPVGTIEAHGTHLPLGTDALAAEAIAEAVAERIGAVLLPTVYYGVTRSLYAYPGSLRVEPDAFEGYLYGILVSIARHGFRSAVIINGHGGGEQVGAIKSAAFRAWRDTGLAVVAVDWWTFARSITEEVFGKQGGHAGTDETAVVAARRPELVKRELYREGEPFLHRQGVLALFPYPSTIINYREGEGEVVFDEARSREYFERVVGAIAGFVEEALRRLEERGLV